MRASPDIEPLANALFIAFVQEPGPGPSRFGRALAKLLSLIIPRANPDFEGLYSQVSTWWVEVDKENEQQAWREIGFNSSGQPIVAGPWGRNYGFWLDTNMDLDRFKSHFRCTELERAEFDRVWSMLDLQAG